MTNNSMTGPGGSVTKDRADTVRTMRVEQDNEQLRAGLLDAEREIAAVAEQRDALLAWCLPMLPAGIYADDPMPADARISRKGDGRLCGSWEPVPGDRYDDLPALIDISGENSDEAAA